MDDLIERLEARARRTNLNVSDGDLFRQAAAEIRNLRAERDAAHAAGLAEGVALGIEAAAVACEEQRDAYLSPQYATGQPLSSIMERMACTTCRDGIRNLDPAAIIAARATLEAT